MWPRWLPHPFSISAETLSEQEQSQGRTSHAPLNTTDRPDLRERLHFLRPKGKADSWSSVTIHTASKHTNHPQRTSRETIPQNPLENILKSLAQPISQNTLIGDGHALKRPAHKRGREFHGNRCNKPSQEYENYQTNKMTWHLLKFMIH